ncbi:MAG: hypothetical protein GWP50_09380 [Proteobacteria bacterium]|nr:hypothetical protein [Pseudomonadota bacterium]
MSSIKGDRGLTADERDLINYIKEAGEPWAHYSIRSNATKVLTYTG